MTQAVTYAAVENPLRDWLRAQPAIVAAFGTDSGLNKPAVYVGGLPDTVAYPACVIRRVGGATAGPLDLPLIRFDIVGAKGSGAAAGEAAAVLASLLESAPASTALVTAAGDPDLHLMGAHVESSIWDPDPTADQPRVALNASLTTKAIP